MTLAEASRRADHRLQRPRQRAGARRGEPEGRRDPLLLDHLQPRGRREGGGLGPAQPEIREKFIGYAEILQVFKITGVGKVAGCRVTEGVARRSAGVRLLRDNVVIHEGKLKTLKRFKDEVKRGPDRARNAAWPSRTTRTSAKATSSRSSRPRPSSASSPEFVRLRNPALRWAGFLVTSFWLRELSTKFSQRFVVRHGPRLTPERTLRPAGYSGCAGTGSPRRSGA